MCLNSRLCWYIVGQAVEATTLGMNAAESTTELSFGVCWDATSFEQPIGERNVEVHSSEMLFVSNASMLSDPAPTTGAHPGGPARDREPFPSIANAVRGYYETDSTGHGMAHVWRVFRLTQEFATTLDADHVVVGAAALTHDLHRVRDEGTGKPPEQTLSTVRSILQDAGVRADRIEAIEACIIGHDKLAVRGDDPAPPTTEAAILRDADNIDAMGAIGIARTFAFAGAHGRPLWDPDGQEYSSLYHFEEKLLQLTEELHTAPARDLAADRHARLERFFEAFRAEWNGTPV